MIHNPRPPVIIIGMHRSGTGMLSRMLEELGLFVGNKTNKENNEALFFYKLNEWMLREANASWDNPYNFNFINDSFKRQIIKVLESHLKGFRRIEYLGPKFFLRYKDIKDLDFPWGWKDPRNTFTVDIWKEIFSDAKILHIYRNPIDVAESLRKREIELQRTFKKNWGKRVRETLLIGRVEYQQSLRVQNIYEGIELWREYIAKAFSLDKDFKKNILHIRYETFTENPEGILKNALNFLELKFSETDILNVVKNVKADRKFAFTGREDLIEIYNQIKNEDIMKKLEYNNIL